MTLSNEEEIKELVIRLDEKMDRVVTQREQDRLMREKRQCAVDKQMEHINDRLAVVEIKLNDTLLAWQVSKKIIATIVTVCILVATFDFNAVADSIKTIWK